MFKQFAKDSGLCQRPGGPKAVASCYKHHITGLDVPYDKDLTLPHPPWSQIRSAIVISKYLSSIISMAVDIEWSDESHEYFLIASPGCLQYLIFLVITRQHKFGCWLC